MLKNVLQPAARSKFLATTTALLLVLTVASMGMGLWGVGLLKAGTTTTAGHQHGGTDLASIQEEVAPGSGQLLPVKWDDMGQRMLQDGVIAEDKLARPIYGLPNLPPQVRKYLEAQTGDQIELNRDTAGFWLEAFWGLGLANQNALLEKGPMLEDTGRLASTAGYEAGARKGMELYNKFSYVKLSPQQQTVVEDIAGHIYRPCCANPTSFPDCNHGMAILGLIELMVSQDAAPEDIYRTALAFNSYWFPQTYQDIAFFYHSQNLDYSQVLASEKLSQDFSSGPGYDALRKQLGHIPWPNAGGASGC